jgi:hypothetical protein
VADWHASGVRPPVAVWTPAQLATFLGSVCQDRLYALWWLAALRGLRRSELAGLRWADLDLNHRQLMIVRARTTAGYQVFEGSPKSAASMRTIALDWHTVAVKTISEQLGHSSIVLTADTYTSVLPAAQHKAAEATARLVLDAARTERNKIALVARRSRVAARKSQKVSPLTLTADQGSSQLTGRRPDTRNDHQPWQPRGNQMTTTIHTGLDEQLSPLLRVARPKRFELPTF